MSSVAARINVSSVKLLSSGAHGTLGILWARRMQNFAGRLMSVLLTGWCRPNRMRGSEEDLGRFPPGRIRATPCSQLVWESEVKTLSKPVSVWTEQHVVWLRFVLLKNAWEDRSCLALRLAYPSCCLLTAVVQCKTTCHRFAESVFHQRLVVGAARV